MRKLLDRLSYANVTATLALFVALGGTSYAVTTLPRNSVGPKQLRTNSVGGSEIRKQAVRSSDIGDRSVRLRDISKSTRDALTGQVGPAGPPGPPGPAFFATVDSAGNPKKGDVGTENVGAGARAIQFRRSMVTCVPVASLTTVTGDPSPAPVGARIRAETMADGRVVVRTYSDAGTPTFYPFNLIVAC
jgi:hypothetical protein